MRFRGAVLAGALMLAACGGSGAEPESMTELGLQAKGIRESAAAGDYEAALQQLNALRSDALDMSRENQLSEEEFRRILAAALEVEARLPSGNVVEGDEGAERTLEEAEPGEQGQVERNPAFSERDSPSAGGSIGTGSGASGRDGGPGRPGEDGEDGEDGADGADG